MPFQGLGALLGRAMLVQADFLLRVTRSGLKQAQAQGGKAVADFNARPEHTRWRIFAFSGYGLLVLLTLAFQLWSPNALAAYVKLQPVSMPDVTVVFVRNDSRRPWKHVKLTLNGLYTYERNDLADGANVMVKIDRFATTDASGRMTFAPKDIVPRTLAVESDTGKYVQEFAK
jgi:hypothetical protein